MVSVPGTLARARAVARAAVCALVAAAVAWSVSTPASRADSPEQTEPRARPGAAFERPFLWRIDREPAAYLFGTIHLPDPRVLDLPEEVTAALEASDVVYTEVPMDPAAQARAQQHLLLPDGKILADVLPADLNQRLERYLASREAPMFVMRRLKPWAVGTMLPLLDWMRGRPPLPALDQYIAERARELGGETDAIETVESQVAAMESMGEQGEIALLRQTLDYMEQARDRGESPIEDLLEVYLTGDEERLLALAREQFDSSDTLGRQVEEALILRRNETMTASIREELEARPDAVHFFALGALHYPGPRGIVALLREAGFRVERVKPPTPPAS